MIAASAETDAHLAAGPAPRVSQDEGGTAGQASSGPTTTSPLPLGEGQGEGAGETPVTPPGADSSKPLEEEPLADECTFDDFQKVDLRVARVIEAVDVPEASKLLRLTLSLGGDVRKTVFAGIKGVYKPEDLVGRLVVCVANLKPRKMKFGISEGMVVAAGAGGKEIFLLAPDEGAKPGHRVH